MSGQDKSAKDKAMAARMKKQGIKRTHLRCSMCHGLVPIKAYPSHIINCDPAGRRNR